MNLLHMKSKALYHCVPVKVGVVATETVKLPFECVVSKAEL